MKKLLLLLALFTTSCTAQTTTIHGRTATVVSLPMLATPSLAVGTVTASTVPLTWSYVAHATNAVVRRSLSALMTSPTTIYTGTGTSITDSGLSSSTTYYYDIVQSASGYLNSAAGTANATTSAVIPVTGPNTLAAPVITSTVTSATSIRIDITPEARATSDSLQRATNNMFTSGLTTIYVGGASSYTDAVTTGVLYYYRGKSIGGSWIPSTYGVTANIASSSTATVSFAGADLHINCSSYAAGTTIKITPGTYQYELFIDNGNGHVIDATGVILEGYNGSSNQPYRVAHLNNCNKTILKGLTIQNCSYFPIYLSAANTGQCTGDILDGVKFINCAQGAYFSDNYPGPHLTYVGTTASTYYLDFTRINCTITNSGGWDTAAHIDTNTVTNKMNNWVDAGNTFSGGNPTQLLKIDAIDNYKIYNNYVNDINQGITNDNRLYIMNGWGDVFYNKCTNYQGHFAACWSVGFDGIVRQSNYYRNICDTNAKYSAFEFQEFTHNITPYTNTANLSIFNNSVGDLNLSHDNTFDANLVDTYAFGFMGGSVYTSNNLVWNVYKTPAINPSTGRAVVSGGGGGAIATDVNNKYVTSKTLAVDIYYNSLFNGIGSQ